LNIFCFIVFPLFIVYFRLELIQVSHRGSSASRQKKEKTKKYRIDEQIPVEETARRGTCGGTQHYEVEDMTTIDPEFPLPDRPVTGSSSDGAPTDFEREEAESSGRKDPILNESSDSSAPTSPLIIPSQTISEIPDKRRREYYSLYVAINHDRSLHDWRLDVLVTDLTNSGYSPYAFRDVRVNGHNEIMFQEPDVSVMNPVGRSHSSLIQLSISIAVSLFPTPACIS
jgi:hypothetical protein